MRAPPTSGVRRRSKKKAIGCEALLWATLASMACLLVYVNLSLTTTTIPVGETQSLLAVKPSMSRIRIELPEDNVWAKKEPLIKILKMANMTFNEELLERLPSWDQVVSRFGPKPRILGLETCAAFNENVLQKDRQLAPAGMFNSGTNLLFQLLEKNCVVHPRQKPFGIGIGWQVNWGKHQSPRFRFENKISNYMDNKNILPVVLVRDPYTWFQSMCKTRYSAHWYHIVPHHCPNFIPNEVEREWFTKTKPQLRKYYKGDPWKIDNVEDKANFTLESKVIPLRARFKNEVSFHDSLAHFYRDWYQEYYDADFPRLIVRLEDLVFHPAETLNTICSCVNGTKRQRKWVLTGGTSKEGAENIHGTNKTDLTSAMIMHVYTNRTQGMTHEDVAFARETLKDSFVFRDLQYSKP